MRYLKSITQNVILAILFFSQAIFADVSDSDIARFKSLKTFYQNNPYVKYDFFDNIEDRNFYMGNGTSLDILETNVAKESRLKEVHILVRLNDANVNTKKLTIGKVNTSKFNALRKVNLKISTKNLNVK